jgi:hypothetical protein
MASITCTKFYPTTVLDRVLYGSKQVQKPYLGQKRRVLCMGIDGLILFLPICG